MTEAMILSEPNLNSRSDYELLRAARSGDENAFVTLFHRWKNPLYRFVFHMTGSRAVAEELTQEVFLALLQRGNRYSSDLGDLSPYLFGIARNLARQSLHVKACEPLEDFPDTREDLPEKIAREDEIRAVRRAVLSLPVPYREVVVLCDLCEISYEEAARRIDCPVGTVRSRLHRAHSILHKKLSNTGAPAPLGSTEGCVI